MWLKNTVSTLRMKCFVIFYLEMIQCASCGHNNSAPSFISAAEKAGVLNPF